SENGKDETKTDMEEARFLLYGGGTHGILRNFIGKSLLPETPASRVEEIRIKIMTIAEEVVGGSERSAARLISLIEREDPEGYDALLSLLPGTGKAHVVGITGCAGAGKSTLINALAVRLARQTSIGVI